MADAPGMSTSRRTVPGWARVALGGSSGGAIGFALAETARPASWTSTGGLAAAQGIWFMWVALGVGAGVIGATLFASRRLPDGRMLALGAIGVMGGGFLSGYLAQSLYSALLDTRALSGCFSDYRSTLDDGALNWCFANTVRIPRVAGWMVAGSVLGVGIGLFFRSSRHGQNAALGGLAGGLVGGLVFDSVPALTGVSSLRASQLIAVALIGGLIGGLTSLITAARVTTTLEVLDGELRGRRYMLIEQTSRIGSARSLEIPIIGDRTVAEVHATVHVTDSGVRIEPTGSALVTVDGRPGAAPLRDGSIIGVGNTHLRVESRRHNRTEGEEMTPVEGQPAAASKPGGRPVLVSYRPDGSASTSESTVVRSTEDGGRTQPTTPPDSKRPRPTLPTNRQP